MVVMAEIFNACSGFFSGARRRHRLALGAAWLICAAGWAITLALPQTYRATASVAVESDDPRALLLTPGNLEQVATIVGLDPTDGKTMARLRAHLDRHVVVRPGDGSAYDVAYTAEGPLTASRVLHALLAAATADLSDPARAASPHEPSRDVATEDRHETSGRADPQLRAVRDEIEAIRAEFAAALGTRNDLAKRLAETPATIEADPPASDADARPAANPIHEQLSVKLARQQERVDALQQQLAAATLGQLELAARPESIPRDLPDEAPGLAATAGSPGGGTTDRTLARAPGRLANLRVIQWPDEQMSAVRRGYLLVAVLASGLILSAMIAGLVARRDDVFDTTWQLRRQLAVSVLAAVPDAAAGAGARTGRGLVGLGWLALLGTFGALLAADALGGLAPTAAPWAGQSPGLTAWF